MAFSESVSYDIGYPSFMPSMALLSHRGPDVATPPRCCIVISLPLGQLAADSLVITMLSPCRHAVLF